MNAATILNTYLPIEGEKRFHVSASGVLIMTRGIIACRVQYCGIVLGARSRATQGIELLSPSIDPSREEDLVDCVLDVSDSNGDVFRLRRFVSANIFLQLVRLSGQRVGISPDQELLNNIRCVCDTGERIPAVAARDEAVIYIAKDLDVSIDLLTCAFGSRDDLAIRVHPIGVGSVVGGRAPELIAMSDWAAKIILYPHFFERKVLFLDPPVFTRLVGTATEPQPAVQFLPR